MKKDYYQTFDIIFEMWQMSGSNLDISHTSNEKKRLEETQTLRAGCSKAEPKKFASPQTLSGGAGRPKFNQLEMVTTFTYKPSLVKIDERNFELPW